LVEVLAIVPEEQDPYSRCDLPHFIYLVTLLLATPTMAQTINTTCSLYPTAVYCTSTDGGAALAAQERQQQYQAGYQAGQAVGSGVGMAVFRAHFSGWRRKYCSRHPEQPFYYGNADGDSMTGTCPNLSGLANEPAAEFVAKHYGSITSAEKAAAIDKYVADNHLPPWEPKSFDKAFHAVKKSGK
jgi:hypothetical protein